MLSKIAKNVTYFFISKNLIAEAEKDIYAYGYEILIAEIINWMATIIITLLTHTIFESAVYMFVFIHLRENIGGFHSKTHIGCTILSVLVHIAFVMFIVFTPINWYAIIILLGIGIHMAIILTLAPVAHPNKPFENINTYKKFKFRSNIFSLSYSLICILLIFSNNKNCKQISYCIILAMLSASISMMVEYLIHKQR